MDFFEIAAILSLADFAGVNLSEMTSMTIMIGDEATEESGAEVLFIDYICLHPVSIEELP